MTNYEDAQDYDWTDCTDVGIEGECFYNDYNEEFNAENEYIDTLLEDSQMLERLFPGLQQDVQAMLSMNWSDALIEAVALRVEGRLQKTLGDYDKEAFENARQVIVEDEQVKALFGFQQKQEGSIKNSDSTNELYYSLDREIMENSDSKDIPILFTTAISHRPVALLVKSVQDRIEEKEGQELNFKVKAEIQYLVVTELKDCIFDETSEVD